MTPPLETPSDSHNQSSEPLSFEPSRETLDRHEAGNLRSSILENFENRFNDLTDEDAAVFIELLSYFNDSAKLTTLREEFKNYEGDATPKDWIRILAQEIPLEQLRANGVIQSKAPYLIREIEGLAPLQGSLESMAEAHRESMEQKRAAVLPQAEEYCSLYFSDVDSSVRERAKANIVQLLVDGYLFNERIQHISGGPIVMDFSNPQNGRHLFLYPNGEVSPFLPERRGSRAATPGDAATSTPEATETAPSDEDYIPQPGESNMVPTDAESETSLQSDEGKAAFMTTLQDFKENPPSTDDSLIKEPVLDVPPDELSEDETATSAPVPEEEKA